MADPPTQQPRTPPRWARPWQSPSGRFVLRFLCYLAIAAAVYPMARERFGGASQALIRGTAKLEYLALRAFSDQVQLRDRTVSFGGFHVRIIEECTAVYEVLIFAAAVLAFPTTWRNKAIGIALGGPLLYAINLFRIGVLLWVGRYRPELFDFMHLYFWQATLILMITSVWLVWILAVVRDAQSRSSGA